MAFSLVLARDDSDVESPTASKPPRSPLPGEADPRDGSRMQEPETTEISLRSAPGALQKVALLTAVFLFGAHSLDRIGLGGLGAVVFPVGLVVALYANLRVQAYYVFSRGSLRTMLFGLVIGRVESTEAAPFFVMSPPATLGFRSARGVRRLVISTTAANAERLVRVGNRIAGAIG